VLEDEPVIIQQVAADAAAAEMPGVWVVKLVALIPVVVAVVAGTTVVVLDSEAVLELS
jgi:hypothetical protein